MILLLQPLNRETGKDRPALRRGVCVSLGDFMNEDKKDDSSNSFQYEFFQPSFSSLDYSFSAVQNDVAQQTSFPAAQNTQTTGAVKEAPAQPVVPPALTEPQDLQPVVPSALMEPSARQPLVPPAVMETLALQPVVPLVMQSPTLPINQIQAVQPDARMRRSHIDAQGALLCFENAHKPPQLRSIEYPDGTRTQFNYDLEGALEVIVDRDERKLRRVSPVAFDGFAMWSLGQGDTAEIRPIVHSNGNCEIQSKCGLRQVTLTNGRSATVKKPQNPVEFEFVLLKVFWRIDVDRSNFLSFDELEQALRQRWFEGDELEVLKFICEKFQNIKDFRRTHANCPGVRADDVLEYAESIKHQKKILAVDSDLIPESSWDSRVEYMDSVSCDQIYATSDKRLSVRADAIKQGVASSPNFLAALRPLAHCNPDAILKMIGDESDGFIPVQFPGSQHQTKIIVTPPDRTDSAKLSRSGLHGQWVRVLEKAYREYLTSFKLIDNVENALALLTGSCTELPVSEFSTDGVSEVLMQTRSRRAAVVRVRPGKSFEVNGNIVVSGQCYGILDVDPLTLKVTLASPWGTGCTCDHLGSPIKWSDGTDGSFGIELNQLLAVAEVLFY